MNPAVIILSVLFFTSLMLSVTMALGWRIFGRPRHALTWAFAFGIATIQWVLNALAALLAPGNPLFILVLSLMVLATSALAAIGCRQRAGLRERWTAFAALALVAAAGILTVNTVWPHAGLRLAIPNGFAALVLPFGAAALWPRGRRANPADVTAAVMFALMALLELALAAIAMGQGRDGDRAAADAYRLLLGIGLPAGYIGIGVAALFVLAADLAERLRILAVRDPLTGVLNRRGLEEAAGVLLANCRRQGQPLAVVVADIDRFKSINDRFGHAAGDRVLVDFAAHVAGAIRQGDLFGRLGGEEFALILPHIGEDGAVEVAERVRAGIAALRSGDGAFTSSFGVAVAQGPEDALADIVARADAALYAAKLAGRDCVRCVPSLAA